MRSVVASSGALMTGMAQELDTSDYAEPEDLTNYITLDVPYHIGGGSFADVYIGTLSRNERKIKVAIKVIRPYMLITEPEKAEKRLKREIRLWSRINHPNVVPLLGTIDKSRLSSHPAMVSPWMNEGNLDRYLDEKKDDLNLKRRLQIVSEVVEGLSYLHNLSVPIIHGDLSPANILMDNGIAHLTDFGLSNVIPDAQTKSLLTSTVGGGPVWTAPELTSSGHLETQPDLTTQCDIYSLGCVALRVISGRIPYDHIRSPYAIAREIMDGKIFPRPEEPLLTDDCWQFILKCCQHEPLARPSISEVRELCRALQSEVDDQDWVSVNGGQDDPSNPFAIEYPDIGTSEWIWTHEQPYHSPPVGPRSFRKTLIIPEGQFVNSAVIDITCDNFYTLYVNGCVVGSGGDWTIAQRYSITFALTSRVVIAVYAANDPVSQAQAGIIAAGTIWDSRNPRRQSYKVVTDASWRCLNWVPAEFNWQTLNDSGWPTVRVEGPYGVYPWYDIAKPTATNPVCGGFTGIAGIPDAPSAPLATPLYLA
ncbi:kinase-like domain-containing protein [Flammula alnicola]|nr:kinase-like domain-containing protein [Flammula alnicola]